jgi:hypothetical protein
MQQNYVVFENVVELNKDVDLEQMKHINPSNPNLSDKDAVSYVGNHRILWVKNKKIIYTLGPHCKKNHIK